MLLRLIYPRAVGAARSRMAGCAAVAGVACAVAALAAAPAGAAYTAEIVGVTLNLVGDAGSDELVLRLQAGVPTMLEVEVGGGGPFVLDRSLFTGIVVTAGAGDDLVQVDEANGAFTDEDIVIDGGEGRDTLIGGTGEEIFIGGADDDLVRGGRGNDLALLGAGDDVATWMPGDGNDTIEGQDGADVLSFTGSNAAENLDIDANGGRVRLFRDVAAVSLDLDDVEQLDLSLLGAQDRLVVNDLAGTDMVRVNVDLAGVLGSGTGDGQLDQILVRGTASPETLELAAEAGALRVEGLIVTFGVEAADPGLDRLDFVSEGPDRVNLTGTKKADVVGIAPSPLLGYARVDFEGYPALVDVAGAVTVGVQGLGGSDTLTGAPGLLALGVSLELFGGKGRDTLTGGDGNDRLFGEGGRDVVEGGGGGDLVFLGGGSDRFTWNPGDGSDVVEGEAGNDRLTFIGSAAAEIFSLSPNGARLLLLRNVANIVMDVAGVEQVDLAALGGADAVTVDDLTGTEVKRVGLDLAGALGGDAGDASIDTVVVNGTAGVDRIRIGKGQGGVVVAGLRAAVRIAHPEVTDMLVVNGLGEVDKIKGNPASLASLLMLVINPD